jgi:hypothetical protein
MPPPAVGVQLPPSARRTSRSRPRSTAMGDCTLRPRSSALQSRTAVIHTTRVGPRIARHRTGARRRSIAGYHRRPPPFLFPKPLGPRRSPITASRRASKPIRTPCQTVRRAPRLPDTTVRMGRSRKRSRIRLGDKRGIDWTLSRQVLRSDRASGPTSETPIGVSDDLDLFESAGSHPLTDRDRRSTSAARHPSAGSHPLTDRDRRSTSAARHPSAGSNLDRRHP